MPDFQNKWRFPHNSGDPGAQALWAQADFTTTVTTLPNDNGAARQQLQDQVRRPSPAGPIDPQPLAVIRRSR